MRKTLVAIMKSIGQKIAPIDEEVARGRPVNESLSGVTHEELQIYVALETLNQLESIAMRLPVTPEGVAMNQILFGPSTD